MSFCSFSDALIIRDDTTKFILTEHLESIPVCLKRYAEKLKIDDLTCHFENFVTIVNADTTSQYMHSSQYCTFLLKFISNYQPDSYWIFYNSQKKMYMLKIEANDYGTIYKISIFFCLNERDKIDVIIVL